MTKSGIRFIGLLAASTITLAGASLGASAMAQETPTTTTTQPGAETAPAVTNANQIDPTATVTLKIQKYLGDPAENVTGLDPLEGAEFKIDKVNDVDLTTQAGWATANQYAEYTQEQLAKLPVTSAGSVTTNAQGLATFTQENGAGLYRVTELNRAGYTTAPAFLVTLPYPREDGAWTYERTVYPKNQQIVPSKQVDDTGATIGSDLTYTINAPVPAGNLSRFNIVDPLNAALSLNPNSVQVSAPRVEFEDGDYTVGTAENTLTVTFNESGRAKLQTARVGNPGLQVSVTFTARITEIPESGSITNTATVQLPNGASVNTNGDDPSTPAVEDVPTSTTFGTLTITKTTDTPNGSLNGADFELYQCSAKQGGGYEARGKALSVATTSSGSPTPSDSPRTTLVTQGGTNEGDDATATGYGVPISSFAALTGTVTNQYCVLETKAPAGYVRNPELQPVIVDAENRKLTVSVANQKNSIAGQLPATGAWGIVLVFLAGLALLARGMYTSFKDSRSAA